MAKTQKPPAVPRPAASAARPRAGSSGGRPALLRRQFDLAADAARVWAWVWNVPRDRLDWMIPPRALLGPRPRRGYADFRSMVHPDDRDAFLAAGRRALAGLTRQRRSVPYQARFRIVRTDGSVRRVEARGRAEGDVRGRPLRMVGVTADVDEQREAEDRRRIAEAVLQHALDGAGAILWEGDASGYLRLSEGWSRLLGEPPEPVHVPVRTLFERVHAEDLRPGRAALVATLKGERPRLLHRFRFRLADGSWAWLETRGTVTSRDPASGRALAVSGVVVDVTAEQRSLSLLELQRDLLARVARGDSARDVILALLAGTEALSPGTSASFLSVRADGTVTGSLGPGLPARYHAALEGLPIGPRAGSCGTAAYRGERVVVADIATDPLWENYRDLALPLGLRACWSQPVRDPQGRVVGTFAMYHSVARPPAAWELAALESLAPVVATALERERAGRALAESESRFRDFARAAAEWFWETDADDRYVWFSEEVERVTGFPREWHYGKRRADLASGTDVSAEPWRSHLGALARHEPFRGFRFARQAPDGLRWISSSGVPMFGEDGRFRGYRGTGRDITEEIRLAERARSADTRLREAIEQLDHPISLTDAEDRIVLVNRGHLALNEGVPDGSLGQTYEEHLRAGLALGLYPGAAGREEAWLAERLAQRRAADGRPIEVARRDGTTYQVTYHRMPDGGILTFALEVTERARQRDQILALNERLEERVAERTAELEESNRQLGALVRELEAFSYSVSHDLKAPLRAIGGFAHMLAEDEGPRVSDEGRRQLAVIEANARTMGDLVEALLALARVNRAELRRAGLDLGHLAREVLDQIGERAAATEVRVQGAMPAAHADRPLARQLLANLLENAIKYSARAASPAIEIGWSPAPGAYFVRDNGAGFDMAYVEKLFRPFERLHAPAEFPGTGIGLAIVKRVAERHGGRVWAEGAPGKGATFWFTLG